MDRRKFLRNASAIGTLGAATLAAGVSPAFAGRRMEAAPGTAGGAGGMNMQIGGELGLPMRHITPSQFSDFFAGSSAAPEGIDSTSWMKGIGGGVLVSHLSVPGSHESCARHGGAPLASEWVVCQTLSIREQLDCGARFLDIRCRAMGEVFTIHHDLVYQKINFGDVLDQCRDFLRIHPSEAIFMRVKQEYSSVSDGAFREIFYKNYLDGQKYRSMFYLGSSIPKLDDVRGKVILLGNVSGLGGIPYGGSECVIQDKYEGLTSEEKLSSVMHHADASVNREQGDDRIYINYLSGYKAPGLSPYSMAVGVQAKVQKFLQNNYAKFHPKPLGIMPMDFFCSDMSWQGDDYPRWNYPLICSIALWNYA
ncbi:phosphatidylinositol-specific phospholipase C [Streptomyces lavendulae]|uniref:phosphatidylinositol-specific phospholipase C n=1 Tax=Streptomyces lavendulae TaxID=1914 RepID=UPI00371A0437